MLEFTPSTRELARRIGVTETALRKAEAKGCITREPDGRWDVEKTRRRMIETADSVRSPLAGAIGAGTTPGRVYPGKRMAGRYGGKQITTRGLVILKVDVERNLLVVKGSVPGKPGALLNIRPANRVGAKAGN